VVETTKQRCKRESLASLSPALAWSLLTPEEQCLIVDYLIKVLEKEVKQETKTLAVMPK
jgi:hypothetical protein